jgi:hypothetical protein
MVKSDQAGAAARPCQPHIVKAGLPYREEYILERERKVFPQMVGALTNSRPTWTFDQAASHLTLELLDQAFASREVIPRIGAAFLAGRCLPADPADQPRLVELLQKLIKSIKPADFDVQGQPYIEAAFSLALSGDLSASKKHLHKLLAAGDPFSDPYLAAYYLAQLGDPSGYPAMLESLQSEVEHTRMMASRYLLGFKPYDGQTVEGSVINLKAEFQKLRKDPSTYVKTDIPRLMKEAGLK